MYVKTIFFMKAYKTTVNQYMKYHNFYFYHRLYIKMYFMFEFSLIKNEYSSAILYKKSFTNNMGSCGSKQDVQKNDEKKNIKSVQEQLHEMWNKNPHVKKIYPSLNGGLASTSNNKTMHQ